MSFFHRFPPAALMFITVFSAGAVLPVYPGSLKFADNLVYNDYFAVNVFFQDGSSCSLFDAAAFEGDSMPWPDSKGFYSSGTAAGAEEERLKPDKNMKYFFWIRRKGTGGAVTYPLGFNKIKSIDFLGRYGGTPDNPVVSGVLELDGKKKDVAVQLNGSGFSGSFGAVKLPVPFYTPAELTLVSGEKYKIYIKSDGFLGGIDQEFGTYAMLWLQFDGIKRIEFLHDGTFRRCPECGAVFYDDQLAECPFDGSKLIKGNFK